MFIEAREKDSMAHDLDIQRWDLKIARDMKLNEFLTADGWVENFKCRHDIFPRRVTNIVTKQESANLELIEKSKETFIEGFYMRYSHSRSS